MKVMYHKFTGSLPIIFVENFKDFAGGILDEMEQTSAMGSRSKDFCRFANFKGSPLKFIVFSEGMMRTLFGKKRNESMIEASLAIFEGSRKYPMNEKLAMNHACKLAMRYERPKTFEILAAEYENRFQSQCPYSMVDMIDEAVTDSGSSPNKKSKADELIDQGYKSIPGYGSYWSRSGEPPAEKKIEQGVIKNVPPAEAKKHAKKSGQAQPQQQPSSPKPEPEKQKVEPRDKKTGKTLTPDEVKAKAAGKDTGDQATTGGQSFEDASVEMDNKKIKAIDTAISSLQSSKSNKKEIGKIISALQSLKETGEISGDMVELISTIVRPVESGKKSYVVKGDVTGDPLEDFSSYDKINGSVFAKLLSDIGVPDVQTAKTVVGSSKMKPERIFVGEDGEPQTTTIDGKATRSGVIFNNQEVKRKKMPSRDKLLKYFKGKGLSDEEVEQEIKFIERSIEKYNRGIDYVQDQIKKGESALEILEPIPGVNPDSPTNREKLANAAIDMVVSRMESLTEGMGKGNIIETLHALKAANGENIDEAIGALTELANDDILKYGMADVVEIFSYVKALKRGFVAYMPAAGNFPLGDIVVLPGEDMKLNSAEDLARSVDMLSVSFESQSVKKGAGAASAAADKIENSRYRDPKAKEDLKTINDKVWTQVWDSKDLKGAEKTLREIAKRHGKDFNEILKGGMGTIDSVHKQMMREGAKVDPKEYMKQLQLEYVMGMLTQEVYNENVITQYFSNEQYKTGKTGIAIDRSDGVRRLSYMKYAFNNKWSLSTGRPDTRLAGHMKNEEARS